MQAVFLATGRPYYDSNGEKQASTTVGRGSFGGRLF
jgi:hypothetical protein